MAHMRKQLRDAVITACTGLTTTGSKVFNHRVYPLGSNKLPGLCIYTQDESSVYQSISPPRSVHRILNVVVESYVKATSGYDNTIDQIALEVEEAIVADVTLGGLAKDTKILGFTSEVSGDGEQPACVGIMRIEVTYCVAENDPETSV